MDQRQFFLRDILTVIFKHLRLLVLFPAAVLAVVVVGSYIWPPTYESVAKIKIMRGREVAQADPTVTSSGSQVMLSQLSVEDVNSEIELLHSENVLLGTVKDPDLMLHKDPAFPYGSGPLSLGIRTLRATVRASLYAVGLISFRTDEQLAMEELDSRLITEPVRDSYVIEVKLRMGDKEKAQKILNTLLKVHQKHHVETYRNKDTVSYFQELLTTSENDLRKAQNELQAFREEKKISMLDTQRELLLGGYTDAVRVLSQLEESERIIASDDPDSSVISSLSSQTESTVVREMQLRLLELLLERNRVVKSLGDNHPTVQSLKQQVKEAQSDLIEAIATTKSLTESKRDKAQDALQELNATKAELDEKEKKVELLTKNYEFYWDKKEEAIVADLMSEKNVSNVKTISDASMPTDPIFPRKLFNIALAILGGVFGALALAFFMDYLDHGLKTPEEVEYFLKAPTLASFFNGSGEKLDKREAERLAIVLDTFHGGTNSNVFQVTSAIPGEGAAQVAAAIADAYSNDPDGRTLLIDLSGEAGGGKSASAGITDVLLNQATLDDVFRGDKALTIVGRGSAGDSATYLWGSEPMARLMEELRRRFKYIVFNIGPVLRSHDALKLAKSADGILIVIRSDATRREVVQRALDMYGENRPLVAGAVLTERTQKIPQAVYRRI